MPITINEIFKIKPFAFFTFANLVVENIKTTYPKFIRNTTQL